MIYEVKEDILAVLGKVEGILREKDPSDLHLIKGLSNTVIHDVTLFEDRDAISVAVLIYALAKTMERSPDTFDYRGISAELKIAQRELKSNDEQGFRGVIRKLYKMVSAKDEEINLYADEVLNHAKVKKSCKVCEHGVSCAKSAELLDVSMWELMQYLGKTTHAEEVREGVDMRTRLQYARSLFQ